MEFLISGCSLPGVRVHSRRKSWYFDSFTK